MWPVGTVWRPEHREGACNLAASMAEHPTTRVEEVSAGVPKESIGFPVQATRIPGLGDPDSGSGRLEPRVVRAANMESGLCPGLIQ
jgi:hypothetical protein